MEAQVILGIVRKLTNRVGAGDLAKFREKNKQFVTVYWKISFDSTNFLHSLYIINSFEQRTSKISESLCKNIPPYPARIGRVVLDVTQNILEAGML